MKLLWLFVPFLASLPAHAGNACAKAVTTPQLNQCAQSEYKAADLKLKAAYAAAVQRIDASVDDLQQRKDTQQALGEAQQLWRQFRDKDCSVVYNFWRGGTIRTVMYFGCMTKHTRQRTRDLDAFKYGP